MMIHCFETIFESLLANANFFETLQCVDLPITTRKEKQVNGDEKAMKEVRKSLLRIKWQNYFFSF